MAKVAAKTQTDELRGAVENGQSRGEERPLRVDEGGVARLRERLRAANRDNPDFKAQVAQLMGAVSRILEKLRTGFADEVEQVVASGGWAREGIDLRGLSDSEEVVLEVVFGAAEVDIDFVIRMSEAVAPEILNGAFYLQIVPQLMHLRERALALPWNHGRADALGIPLLVRG